MSRISVKGAIIGGIVDVVATNIISIPLVVVVAMQISVDELPKAERTQAITSAMHSSPTFLVTSLILGSLCSVLGGYVAARIAKSGALLNAALSSWLAVAMGVYSMFGKSNFLSPVQHVLLLIATPVLAAMGGVVWQRQKEKAELSSASAPLSAA
jgi:hypothetical protein